MQHTIEALQRQLSNGNVFCRMRYRGDAVIVPVEIKEKNNLNDLLAIDEHKKAVLDNLEAFMQGRAYNHILLWGARGTGKSSLIRGAFEHFEPQGLKLLQIASDDLQDLAFILWVIGLREDKFMVFIDDLSFSENDDSYRALKAILDGSIAGMPKQVVLCVTSNRRHLLKEHHIDDNSLHPEEDAEEEISLAERFGLRISFHPLSQKTYLEIVSHYAKKVGIAVSEELHKKALQFSLLRGSRSARVAAQFINDFSQK